jgi:hypothetical protein
MDIRSKTLGHPMLIRRQACPTDEKEAAMLWVVPVTTPMARIRESN